MSNEINNLYKALVRIHSLALTNVQLLQTDQSFDEIKRILQIARLAINEHTNKGEKKDEA